MLHPYETEEYGRAFEALHRVERLPLSGTNWLERPIAGSEAVDFIAAYPVLRTRRPEAVREEMAELASGKAVSAVFVSDALQEGDSADGYDGFDVARPFKTHFIVTSDGRWRERLSAHHARKLRRVGRSGLQARLLIEPGADYGGTFWRLYETLIRRHDITGLQAFAPEIVARHCALPGMLATEVRSPADDLLGVALWAHDGTHAHLHLHAQSGAGYELEAGYAAYAAALDHFAGRVDVVDLGGGAGAGDSESGLTRFKRGWSDRTATAWLYGAILDRDRYGALAVGRGSTGYFPAYRAPAN